MQEQEFIVTLKFNDETDEIEVREKLNRLLDDAFDYADQKDFEFNLMEIELISVE